MALLPETKRTPWIDTLKGIGITLVIVGHLFHQATMEYIYSFHMPLFFFISGYLFKKSKYPDYPNFLKKKVKSLLIPYLFFSIITYLFWLFVGRHFGIDVGIDISLIKPFAGIFYSNSANYWLLHNTPLWFLTCLFIVENLFYFLSKYFDKTAHLVLVLVFCSFFGFYDSLYIPLSPPWSADVAFSGVVFFGIGNIVSSKNINIRSLYLKILVVIILAIINIVFGKWNGRVNMSMNEYNNYFYFYIASLSGIFAYVLLAQTISCNVILSFIGKNTLTILALHSILISVIKGIQSFVFHIPLAILDNSLLWTGYYTVAINILLLPIIYIINTYFSFFVGKSEISRFKIGELLNKSIN